MKLISSPHSPYARKAIVLARLSNVTVDEIVPERDGANGYIASDNPLGKIPALEWRPGQYLFDSPVICEYLDSLSDTPLLPASGHARFIQLWQHALGDGLSDAVYNYRFETVRPENLHWNEIIERHEHAIRNTVATLERISPWLGEDWTYGNVAIICGLDYASFRAGHIDWKADAPKLKDWHAKLSKSSVWKDTFAYQKESA